MIEKRDRLVKVNITNLGKSVKILIDILNKSSNKVVLLQTRRELEEVCIALCKEIESSDSFKEFQQRSHI